jgi:hypothetical protein
MMKWAVRPDLNKFQGGCALFRLSAVLVLIGFGPRYAHASETFWGCLLYAANDDRPSDVPARISNYDRRLSEAVGYTKLHLLGEGQTAPKSSEQNWLVFGGDIKVQFTSLTKTDDGKYVVGLQLYQEEKELIETRARVGQNIPLFIRGPEWRDGKIIIVVMIAP